jgi:hypothetical protein
MSSLFQHTDSPSAFIPKKEDGVLASYCANCGQRLEVHGTVWISAQGSLRVCPHPDRWTLPGPATTSAGSEFADRAPSPIHDEPPRPLQPIRSPFGTDYNVDPFARKGGRGHLVGAAGGAFGDHLQGAACESTCEPPKQKSVPCQSYNQSHLRGAGLHNLETEPKRVALPCQRTNDSHLRGASIQTVATQNVYQNHPHH